MADWLEGFLAMRLHVLIRFGRWQEIIASAGPRPGPVLRITAMRHYAQGVAVFRDGAIAEAEVQRIASRRCNGCRSPG